MIIFVLSKDAFVSAEQWFTTAGDFALWRGHLSTSKDIFGCHNWWDLSVPSGLHACKLSCSVVSDCDPLDCSLPGSSVHGIF